MSDYETGKKRMREILGEKADAIINGMEKMSPEFAGYIVEHAYGDIYERKVLDDRSKEIAAVSCLIGLGLTGVPLRSHIYGMLNTGWNKKEIIELLIFLTSYAGFPVCLEALFTANEVFT